MQKYGYPLSAAAFVSLRKSLRFGGLQQLFFLTKFVKNYFVFPGPSNQDKGNIILPGKIIILISLVETNSTQHSHRPLTLPHWAK